MKRWLIVSVLFLFGLTTVFATGYWAFAQQDMGQRGHMMNGQSDKRMPMMHSNMSKQEMSQYCERMTNRHEAMVRARRKNTQKLTSLVQSMKQASGNEKVAAMEDVVVELVEQHNRRGTMMMKSRHAMMKSMMGMQRMDRDQRRRMMNRMQDCPVMKNMMDRNNQRRTPMRSPDPNN